MKFRALFLVLLLILSCASLLGGCAGQTAETPGLEETPPASSEPQREPLEPDEATSQTEPVPETAAPAIEPTAEPLELSAAAHTFAHKGELLELTCADVDPARVQWTSGDLSVAIVAGGRVVATGAGSTLITAECDGRSGSCEIISEADPDEELPYIDPDILHAPLLLPPETDADVSDYFDDVIILGDSLTYSLYQWETLYNGMGDVLFLVRGGASIQSFLDGRYKFFYDGKELWTEDAVAATGRKKLFILMGANDMPQFGVEGTLERFDTLLERILEKTPDLEIHIQSVTPVWTDAQYPGFTNEEFDEYNELQKAYAAEHGYGYVDIAPYFKDSTNGIAKSYCSDQLVHASYDGAGVWVQVLKAYIAEQMDGGTE